MEGAAQLRGGVGQTGHDIVPMWRARFTNCGFMRSCGGRLYRGNLANMTLPQSKVTSQGQISVPAEIRRKLGIGPGSVLEWEEEGDHVIVRRAGLYSSEDIHQAVFSHVPKRRSVDEFKRGIAEHMRKKYARR